MPRKQVPTIQLQQTNSLDHLRQQVQEELNKVLLQVNSPEFQSNLNLNFNRINRVQDAVEDFDAVNLSQLRRWAPLIFASRRRDAAPRGAPEFVGKVLNNGIFTLDELELPGNPMDLHALTLSVDETTMATLRGTLGEVVDVAETDIDITGLTGVVAGDYLLLHTPTQNGATAVTNDEVVFVTAVVSNTYTVVRGRWGSSDVAHASGEFVFPLEIRHFSDPGQTNFSVLDKRVDEPARFDCLLPSHCVVACKAFAANNGGAGPTTTRFLPVYSADAEDTPLMPGLRTLAGQAYLLPISTSTLAVGDNALLVHVKIQDTASIRTIYGYVDTAPTGAPLTFEVKKDNGAGAYTNLDTFTIAAGSNTSYASGNEPALRRMPYGINWANLTPLTQDHKLQVDITGVGSTIAGGKFMAVVQT
ncbi:MAG: hypothetical protein MN733_43845 [Nitrososphaera sp.]|nr:hypothetical protein [Nitrososphaera sp.]